MATQDDEYREGDLIRATKSDTIIQGTISRGTAQGGFTLFDAGWPLSSLITMGWTIEVLERAPDPLPTEPGYYVVHTDYGPEDETVWHFGNGDWYEIGEPATEFQKPENFTKIERLYTKDEVLTKVRKVAWVIDHDYLYDNSGTGLLELRKRLEEYL